VGIERMRSLYKSKFFKLFKKCLVPASNVMGRDFWLTLYRYVNFLFRILAMGLVIVNSLSLIGLIISMLPASRIKRVRDLLKGDRIEKVSNLHIAKFTNDGLGWGKSASAQQQ